MKLQRGHHAHRADGMCLMEYVAWIANEVHSDSPRCACPVIAAFARRLSDSVDDEDRTALLLPFARDIMGSRNSRLELRRAYVAVDHAVRVFAPLAFEWWRFTTWAERLRTLPPITDRDSLYTAMLVVKQATQFDPIGRSALDALRYLRAGEWSAAAHAAACYHNTVARIACLRAMLEVK